MRIESRGWARGRLHTIVAAVTSFVWIFLAVCSARPDPTVESIMVAPQSWIREAGGIVRMVAPVHTHDERYKFPAPTIDGWSTI